jgi:hypothetical protein
MARTAEAIQADIDATHAAITRLVAGALSVTANGRSWTKLGLGELRSWLGDLREELRVAQGLGGIQTLTTMRRW